MARRDIEDILSRVAVLAEEMDEFAPASNIHAANFRADLGGLLTVAIASTYEECVKEVLINFAASKHPDFEKFARNNFGRLSSKVMVSDLMNYAAAFDQDRKNTFKESLQDRKSIIKRRTGVDIQERYEQLLKWRHDYAHEGKRNTTIEEALIFHRFGKRVILCFDQAFPSEEA